MRLAVLFAGMGLAQEAHGATLRVCASGCPYSTLASAVAAASDGDVLELGAGEVFAGGVTVSDDLIIRGAAGARPTIQSSGATTLNVGSNNAVTLSGVNLLSVSARCLVLDHPNSSLVVENVDFDCSAPSSDGPALFVGNAAAPVVVRGSQFLGATTSGCGGSVFVRGQALQLSDSTFVGGLAGEGGALCLEDAEATLTNVHFEGVAATNDGGAVFVDGGALVATQCTFLDAEASDDGGALFAQAGATVDLTDVDLVFSGGEVSAAGEGGAIYLNDAPLVATNLWVSGAESGGHGGALRALGDSPVTLTDSLLESNTSGLEGGAIYFGSSGELRMVRTEVLGSFSGGRGGALRLVGDGGAGSASLEACWFEDNVGSEGGHLFYSVPVADLESTFRAGQGVRGGAIRGFSASPLTLVGSQFDGNEATAGRGGAVLVGVGGAVTLERASFLNSSASDRGGHLAWQGAGSLTVRDSSFIGGEANFGGALHLDGAVVADVTSTLFERNTSLSAGGAVDARIEAEVSFRRCQFTSNVADTDGAGGGSGGAINHVGLAFLVDRCTFIDNRAANGGAVRVAGTEAFSILRSRFCGNVAAAEAGAVGLDGSPDGLVANNLFLADVAGGSGAALWSDGAVVQVYNNSVVAAEAASSGGAVAFLGEGGDFRNNHVHDTRAGGGLSGLSATIARYDGWSQNLPSDVVGAGSLDGTHVRVADPLLTGLSPDGPACDDLPLLLAGSPLINAGDPSTFDFLDGTRADIGWTGGPYVDDELFLDADGDGFTVVEGDCDDGSPAVFPGAMELPSDGLDNDCDGLFSCYLDLDADGWGGAAALGEDPSCGGRLLPGGDCRDDDPEVFPGRAEVVGDAVDQDCDGRLRCYVDSDGDRVGSGATLDVAAASCVGEGRAAVTGDCRDDDRAIFPGAVEGPADGRDQDCDGLEACWRDSDGDGAGAVTVLSPRLDCSGPSEARLGGDCDDDDPARSPTAAEVPGSGVDEDCDGLEACFRDLDGDGAPGDATALLADLSCLTPGFGPLATDCDDSRPEVGPDEAEVVASGRDEDCDGEELCWRDADRDGFGGSTPVVSSNLDCTDPGESTRSDDCGDGLASRYPGAPEVVADRIDQDCDGGDTCYADQDGDGWGDPLVLRSSLDLDCTDAGEADDGLDCDDEAPDVRPDGVERAGDEVDQDCNGTELCWRDLDLDGWGSALTVVSPDLTCRAAGEALASGDCDDARPEVSPGAVETPGDALDADCDGLELCFLDEDGDSYGGDTTLSEVITCLAPGLVARGGDCADEDLRIFPGAAELIADGIDQDCSGGDLCYLDSDRDGFGGAGTVPSLDLDCADPPEARTSSDCDDRLAGVYPGASEVPDDGIDQDCNGSDTVTCRLDADGDGFGGLSPVLAADGDCLDRGEAPRSDDCDDDDPGIFPGAPEVRGDRIDQDCNGSDLIGCYLDADEDGFGSSVEIDAPDGDCLDAGESDNLADCDDADPASYPGAEEVCGDGRDQDCDGLGGLGGDDDGDGLSFEVEAGLGTDDCNPDSDRDGLADGDEVRLSGDPRRADTDNDLVRDGLEVPDPLRPLNTDGDALIDLLDPDDDGDLVPTREEDRDDDRSPTNDDTDRDGVPDYLDLDDDGDGLPTSPDEDRDRDRDPQDDDTDDDLIPDYLDEDDDGDGLLTLVEVGIDGDPWGSDSDRDGIEDGVEGEGALTPEAVPDADGDGLPNPVDDDDDGDGIPTLREGGLLEDADEDGVPNYLDLDSDDDGRPDAVEGVGDDDRDTLPNFLDPDDTDGGSGDPDGDGLTTFQEDELGTDPIDPDSDADLVPDGAEAGQGAADTDGDRLPDALDPDDDGDGASTLAETGLTCTAPGDAPEVAYRAGLGALEWRCVDEAGQVTEVLAWTSLDTDLDGLPDRLDQDDDGDGVPSRQEDADGDGDLFNDDRDGDQLPDFRDAADEDGPLGDLDGDGLDNAEEEARGTDPLDRDSDDDGVPDGEELPGDSDGDGLIDALDPDDDGDGVSTREEGRVDTDGDGLPNYLDLDSDGDGSPDSVDAQGDRDCDGVSDRLDASDDGSCEEEEREVKVISGGCQTTGGRGLSLWVLLLALAGRRRDGAGRQR